MKNLVFVIFLITAGSACKQDAKQASTDAATTETPETTTTTSGTGKLQLTCENMGTTGDVPKNAIYAIADERKTKLMEITSACMQVEKNSYAGYGIPADAVAVVGSWFAGIGDFFYAKQEGSQINVYYSAIGEEAPPGGIHTYYKIATYENGKTTVHELE